MNKFLTLLEGGIIGAALLILFDHVVGKLSYRSYRRPTHRSYWKPTYSSYRTFRDDEEEDE